MVFGSTRAFGRIGFENAGFLDLDAAQVENRQETNFPVGRPENRVTLVQDELGDQVLCECGLPRFTTKIDGTARRRCGGGDRCRNAAPLERRVRNQAQRDEPVFTKCGTIAFEYVVAVVGVPQTLGIPERRHDAPAIGDSSELGHWSPDRRLQAFAITDVRIGWRSTRASSLAFGREFAIRAGIQGRIGVRCTLCLGKCCARRQKRCDGQPAWPRATYLRKHSAHRCQ